MSSSVSLRFDSTTLTAKSAEHLNAAVAPEKKVNTQHMFIWGIVNKSTLHSINLYIILAGTPNNVAVIVIVPFTPPLVTTSHHPLTTPSPPPHHPLTTPSPPPHHPLTTPHHPLTSPSPPPHHSLKHTCKVPRVSLLETCNVPRYLIITSSNQTALCTLRVALYSPSETVIFFGGLLITTMLPLVVPAPSLLNVKPCKTNVVHWMILR